MKSYKDTLDDLVKRITATPIEDLERGSVMNTFLEKHVKDNTRYELRKFLAKLGIRSAEIDPFEKMFRATIQNFGQPDRIIMSPDNLDIFMKTFGVKK